MRNNSLVLFSFKKNKKSLVLFRSNTGRRKCYLLYFVADDDPYYLVKLLSKVTLCCLQSCTLLEKYVLWSFPWLKVVFVIDIWHMVEYDNFFPL